MSKILFICPGFHEYDKIIENAMIKQGHDVTKFIPIGTYSVVEKVINKLSGDRYICHKKNKRKKNILLADSGEYDYVFMIAGECLDTETLRALRERQKKAKFILYLWDDICRVNGYFDNVSYYDEIYTYALTDAETYHLKFLPMFVPDTHVYQGEPKQYKFSLLGMLHSERMQIWSKIVKDNGLDPKECYLYLMGTQISHFVQSVLPFGNPWMSGKYVHINSASFRTIGNLMKRSKVTLDVQHSKQKGVSSRTIEALGAHAKVVTTNPYVEKYDFYSYGNVYIIDRTNPVVPKEFFETDFQEMPKEIWDKYYIDCWIKKMFQ